MKKILTIVALLCASVMGWATVYENTALTLDAGETNGQTLTLSICKSGANTTQIVARSTTSVFTGVYECIWQQYGGGSNPTIGDYTVTDHEITFTTTWETYPTSATQLRFVARRNNSGGGSDIFGGTATSAEITGECIEAGSCLDETNPEISAVSVGGITYNSAVLTISASDNIAVTRYVVKNGDIQIAQGTSAEITLTGLTSGTTYDNIKVFAYDACNNESPAFAVSSFTTLARPSECFGTKGHFGNPSVKHVFYQIDYTDSKAVITLRSLTGYDLDFAEVHISGVGNYAMTADGNGGYTHTINNPTVNSEWFLRFLYSDTNMGGNEMTSQDVSSSDANIIYYKVGECTYSVLDDTNYALSSNGASAVGTEAENNSPSFAIDGDNSTRWSSEWDVDPQDFVLDLGQRRSFNTIQFVWYTTYSKQFDLLISDDANNWVTIKSVNRTLENADYHEETFSLGFAYVARYIKFHGIVRGGGYGHSFREIRVINATEPVLTTYTASIPTSLCVVGSNYQVSVVAKDQVGNDYAVETTYSVSPVGAGTITSAGVYTPVQLGAATITAEGGGKSSSVTVRNEVSEDLALNKPATAGHNNENAYQSNNGNLGQRWGSNGATHYAADPINFGDWWYVDLGAKYDISEIAIKWETARPNDYDIRVSDDASTWTTIGTFDSYPSNTQYEYYNSLSAIPGRYVGVWARQGHENLAYGISMWDFKVFGTENLSANKAVSATASPVAGGSVTVQAAGIDVTEVENGTEVTFTATPNEGYDFVNWTNGGVEVSTSTTYVAEITSTTGLVANFEVQRTAYCSIPLADTQGRTVYLTISKTENENEYKILLEGSAENKLRGENVYVGTGLTLRNVNGESTYSFGSASGEWHVSAEGFGSAYITFTATDFRAISFANKGVDLFRDNSAGGSDLSSFNAFPDANLIKWDATCTDDEAPILAAPAATPLSGTSVRLALSATDNMAALLTYSINYKPAGNAGAGADIEVMGAAGETMYKNIKGLSAGIHYQFSVTVSDGTNTSDALICYATPSMPLAPVPSHNAGLVRSVYSDNYESALAHDFIKNNWSWITYSEQVIGGDHLLVYTSDPSVQTQMPDVAWGDNNDGENAIIAKDAFNAGGDNKGLDVRQMDYIHFDMWSAIATIYPELYLNDVNLTGFQLNGSGWQSFDLPLASLTAEQKMNIRWIKFIALRTPNPEEIAIDNVYFWSNGVQSNVDSWATFASSDDVKVPDDVTVYSAVYSKNGNEEVLTLTDAGKVIPAGTGVLLKGENNNTAYAFAVATSDDLATVGDKFDDNCLVGCTVRTDVSAEREENDIFCLRRSELFEQTAFFLYEGQYIPAGKAYLKLPKNVEGPSGASRRVSFVFDTVTTVDELNADAAKVTKFIENGQLFIRRGDAVYTVQGTRVK